MPGAGSRIEQVKKFAAKLALPAARIGLAVATAGVSEAAGSAYGAVAGATTEEGERALDAFWKREEGRRAAMEGFRDAIGALTRPEPGADGEGASRPLVFVVDELDRCRPDYALQVLEIIRHFFAVAHVHFILGANLAALENSVRARYGDKIDATAYLQKFVSLRFSLPDTVGGLDPTLAVVGYAKDAGARMGLPGQIVGALAEHLEIVSRSNPVSIRDVGKILSTLAMADEKVLGKQYHEAWLAVMTALATARQVRPELYGKFVNATISPQEIREYFGASETELSEEIGGIANRYYDPELAYHNSIWLYIVQDDGLDELAGRRIKDAFGFSHARPPRDIPLKVQKRWLDPFRLG